MNTDRLRAPAAIRNKGFTLLEMLLAVLVFSFMASAAYGILNSMTAAAAEQRAAGERLQQVQLAFLRVERELRQTLSTGMFSADHAGTEMRGDPFTLEFNYLTQYAPLGGLESRWVQYRYENDTLYRMPAGAFGTRGLSANFALAEGLTRLQFSYRDARGNWNPRWDHNSASPLPAAVRIEIETANLGVLSRVVELPGDRP